MPPTTKLFLRHAAFALLPLLGACSGMASWEGSQQAQKQSYNIPPAPPREADPIPSRPVGPADHLVKKGDTLYSIAFRNQVDYRDLARWNNIPSDFRIYPGQVLQLSPASRLIARDGQIASQGVNMNEVGDRPRAISTQPTAVVMAAPAPTSAASPLPPDPFPNAAPPTVSTPVVPTASGSGGIAGWRWPVNGVVTRGFNPDAGSRGLDFTGTVGQPVVASAPGKVVYSGSALKGYGELIIIKHDELHLSAYGYNSKRLVNEGDVIAAGQQIAEMGTGPESKPLLHFEIRERGKPVNPVPFLPARQ